MSRKRLALLLLLLTGAVAAWLSLPTEVPAPAAPVEQRRADAPAVPGAPPSQIPPRPEMGEARGEPFAPRSWAPPQAAAPASRPAAPPAPPPMPYRYAGRIVRQGVEEVLLARGDELISVREGATLDASYRVESITAEKITLRYLPLGVSQSISLLMVPADRKPR